MSKKIYNIKNLIERLKNYCALNEKCQWDIKQKMQKWGVNRILQNNILEVLTKEKYIDEERYSRSFCRGKFRIKKWGRLKIINELKKKDISEKDIDKGLEEINEYEYRENLESQYQKKKKSIIKIHHLIRKRKIATYLINKGYESNLVWNKIRELE